jgi:ring-1,2-phenylacetyl-CoA epoxidase subunit PaaD
MNNLAISEKEQSIWNILESVADPEIPVLSIVDLGIAREVNFEPNGDLEVVISPTYSGCPAMDMISDEVKNALTENGYKNAVIKLSLSPAWTTDWMSEAGKRKLAAYGIAPPEKTTTNKRVLFGGQKEISCPRCHSEDSEQISEFGSTPCKALYRCKDCLEPFDYFKCI